jgi:ubiquinone/menaquinone biosynthesis C-methylase UbiE
VTTAKYDRLGVTYACTRTTEPRIAAQIRAQLGDARTVCNVGAGTGSYEPADRAVVAVEPSTTMLEQRPAGCAPAVRAFAEQLPFADRAFDACMAVLTLHHWNDLEAGLAEMRRVAPRQVVCFFEPSYADAAWLIADYFPEILDLENEQTAPGLAEIAAYLDVLSCDVVPVPADCIDGFAGSFWNRPEAYLRPDVQRGISGFMQLPDAVVAAGTARLRADLASGRWDAKYGFLRAERECDLGYRLLRAGS